MADLGFCTSCWLPWLGKACLLAFKNTRRTCILYQLQVMLLHFNSLEIKTESHTVMTKYEQVESLKKREGGNHQVLGFNGSLKL